MAQNDWTAIRVSRQTKAQLEELRARLELYAHTSPRGLGSASTQSGSHSKNDVVGLDQVVRRLLNHYQEHQGRKRKHRRKAVDNEG